MALKPTNAFLVGATVVLGCALIITGVFLGIYIDRYNKDGHGGDGRRPMDSRDMAAFYHKMGMRAPTQITDETAITPYIRNNLYNARLHYVIQSGTEPLVKQPAPSLRGTWTPLPISPTGRHWYNPTFVPAHTKAQQPVVFMRDDNIDELWTADAKYVATQWNMRKMQARGYPFHLELEGLPTARCRKQASERGVVLEDVRYVPELGGPFGDRRRYVAGVTYRSYATHATKFVLLKVSDDGRSLRLVTTLDSPTGSRVEKNWQIMRTANDEFTVIYNFQPRIAVYKFGSKETELTFVHESRDATALPPEWTQAIRTNLNQPAPMRLSGVIPLQGSSDVMLMTHARGVLPHHQLHYLNFALRLDTKTWRPKSYIPFPILADIGVGIRFLMGGVEDKKSGNFRLMVGIADRVGGVQSYPRSHWIHSALNWPHHTIAPTR